MVDLSREFFKHFNWFKNKNMVKFCFYGKNCVKTCKAHSIQENGILNKIAFNGKVITFDFSKEIGYHSVGIKQASTFSGFCSRHDQEIFKPIEKTIYQQGNQEQEFLFVYRAFAKEYFNKSDSRKMGRAILNNPGGIYECTNIEGDDRRYHMNSLRGTVGKEERDLVDYEEKRKIFNERLKNKTYNKMITHTIVFDREYKIAASDAFVIYRDRGKQLIYDLYDGMDFFYNLYLTIFPQEGKTYIIFSYDEKAQNKYGFIKKQIVDEPTWIQKIIVSNIIAQYVKNFYFSPVLAEKLDLVTKDKFLYYFQWTAMRKTDLVFDKKFNLFIDY